MRAAEAKGAALRLCRVTGLARRGGTVTGVTVDGATIEGDAVVIAMGPWSILAAKWLPLPAVYGLKGHSLVFDTGTSVPAEALFAEYREPTGALSAPEVFPRNDGTTYVCAISSETPLPVDPADVAPDPDAIERLEGICRRLSPVLAKAKVLAAQACYRPVTLDGLPLIGRVAGLDNAYVATGHSVWGILNAPATGEAMAELIVDGSARTVDLSPFDPTRCQRLTRRGCVRVRRERWRKASMARMVTPSLRRCAHLLGNFHPGAVYFRPRHRSDSICMRLFKEYEHKRSGGGIYR
jgi:glycine/D-amino acid oxidase-like deaminating enzyme